MRRWECHGICSKQTQAKACRTSALVTWQRGRIFEARDSFQTNGIRKRHQLKADVFWYLPGFPGETVSSWIMTWTDSTTGLDILMWIGVERCYHVLPFHKKILELDQKKLQHAWTIAELRRALVGGSSCADARTRRCQHGRLLKGKKGGWMMRMRMRMRIMLMMMMMWLILLFQQHEVSLMTERWYDYLVIPCWHLQNSAAGGTCSIALDTEIVLAMAW